MTASESVIGVIGGSGIYDIEGLSNTRWEGVSSPFGEPSDELLFGDVEGQRMVFLPRHGRGHKLPPDGVNYRANIDALKHSGVTDILSLSAVGSLREELSPGTFGSSPELCVKVRGSSSMLLLGCLGDLLRFEKREIQVATFAPDRSSP